MAATQTPWGRATTVEEVSIPQRSGDRRFSIVVQLLETGDGEALVRFSYSTGGAVRRGPVTLRMTARAPVTLLPKPFMAIPMLLSFQKLENKI